MLSIAIHSPSSFAFPSPPPPLQLDGLSVSQMKELREKAEKYTFEAEVNKMMRLIINSLYRNKEVRVCVSVLVCVCSAMFGMM